MNVEDLKAVREFELDLIRQQEAEVLKAKESFVKNNGWHKEEHQGFKGVEIYWCKDDVAISDIDDVIDLIEESLKGE